MTNLTKISPKYDPWEAYFDQEKFQAARLTNIEFTTTNLCNMRCEHCAVGYTLQMKDNPALPIELLIKKLDEVQELQSLSITGGEPMLSKQSAESYVLPLLKYAHSRGVRTQLNSNLTVPFEKYEAIAPYLDVLHISHNWGTIEQFIHNGFARMENKPSEVQRGKLFEHMIENSQKLAKGGMFISAETMLSPRTMPYLEKIHTQIWREMGCLRHEVHPMYNSDFAENLPMLSLEEIRASIYKLLDIRNENIWMLFGTLPFYACSDKAEDLALLERLYQAKNVTVRNDPDGRSRLNINIFTGDIIVTDFGDFPPVGNILENSLQDAYEKWRKTDLCKSLSCHCPSVKCLGPNVLVKNKYYPEVDFKTKKADLRFA